MSKTRNIGSKRKPERREANGTYYVTSTSTPKGRVRHEVVAPNGRVFFEFAGNGGPSRAHAMAKKLNAQLRLDVAAIARANTRGGSGKCSICGGCHGEFTSFGPGLHSFHGGCINGALNYVHLLNDVNGEKFGKLGWLSRPLLWPNAPKKVFAYDLERIRDKFSGHDPAAKSDPDLMRCSLTECVELLRNVFHGRSDLVAGRLLDAIDSAEVALRSKVEPAAESTDVFELLKSAEAAMDNELAEGRFEPRYHTYRETLAAIRSHLAKLDTAAQAPAQQGGA